MELSIVIHKGKGYTDIVPPNLLQQCTSQYYEQMYAVIFNLDEKLS